MAVKSIHLTKWYILLLCLDLVCGASSDFWLSVSVTSMASNVFLITIILILVCIVSRNNRACQCETFNDELSKSLETKDKTNAQYKKCGSDNRYEKYIKNQLGSFDNPEAATSIQVVQAPNRANHEMTRKPPQRNPSILEFGHDTYETIDFPDNNKNGWKDSLNTVDFQAPNRANHEMTRKPPQRNPSILEVGHDTYETIDLPDNNKNGWKDSLNAKNNHLEAPKRSFVQAPQPQPGRHKLNSQVNHQPQNIKSLNNKQNNPTQKMEIEGDLYMDASKRNTFVKTLTTKLVMKPNIGPKPTTAPKMKSSAPINNV